MDIKIIKVRTNSELKKFIMLPWEIYEGNSNWVPPLISDMKKTLKPLIDPVSRKKECELFLALKNNKPVARIFTGINRMLNDKKNEQMGYFALFECINDIEVSKALFDKTFSWFRERGITIVRGPVSIEGADMDENKGLLINAFDCPPVIMNSYNPEYYIELFEKYGLEKYKDVYAYYLDSSGIFKKDPSKVIEYAKKKYGFRVDTINLNNLENELKDIKYILDLAVPEEWDDLVAPDFAEIESLAKSLVDLVDPEIVLIARTVDNRPIGFLVAVPDYNQLLKHINGRLTPFSIFKYLKYKKKIDGARILIMFVIPEFRKKGVSFAMYHQCFINGLKKGYTWGEGSTIGEDNFRMRTDIESMGAEHYKTYRVYKWNIQ
ncbi:MAG: hypothetical protein GYA02_04720 [Clostridiaceae bacterium]|jgi:GNAT superfamily N-acetyltransferase|nr:hypothetical protein [Clostridiaceae bacterium]